MANLTVTIDDDTLKRARMRALEQETSVNAVVRAFLEGYADPMAAIDARRRVVELARGSDAGGDTSGRTWTRDDLYAGRTR